VTKSVYKVEAEKARPYLDSPPGELEEVRDDAQILDASLSIVGLADLEQAACTRRCELVEG
jgi:hypothetical protein